MRWLPEMEHASMGRRTAGALGGAVIGGLAGVAAAAGACTNLMMPMAPMAIAAGRAGVPQRVVTTAGAVVLGSMMAVASIFTAPAASIVGSVIGARSPNRILEQLDREVTAVQAWFNDWMKGNA